MHIQIQAIFPHILCNSADCRKRGENYMNPKISKLKNELERNENRILSLQSKNKLLREKITGLENADIIALFRASGMTIEELAAIFGKTEEKPAPKTETEENKDEIQD